MTDYFDLLDAFFKSIGQEDYFFSPYDLVNDNLEKKKLAIKAIDFLLSKNDKGLYKETWNFIGYRQLSQINLKDLKPLCPTNVYKFLEDRYAAYKKVETLEGYEKPVLQTDRIILRGIKKGEEKLFIDAYTNEGDFAKFAGCECNEDNIKLYVKNIVTGITHLVIEDKASHKIVGYCGLCYVQSQAGHNIEYYIFKDQRRKGYAIEACRLLIDAAFNDKLFTYKEKEWGDILEKEIEHVDFIFGHVSGINEGSMSLLKSLGFTYTGYEKHNKVIVSMEANEEPVTTHFFYLEKKDYKK